MVGDERARHELLVRLQQVLGDKEAATLMEHLPPDRWPELVTKSDLSPVRADVARLKTDVAGLKTDVAGLKTDVAGLKTDVAELRHEMQLGFALVDQRFEHLEGSVDQRFEHLEENLELRFESAHDRMESFVRERLDAQTRALLFTIIGALLTMALVAVGTS
jgi:predicted RNase H-like nuclease (RuvC/YqgF family)